MELFLLFAMGLTIVAFLSIVLASPRVLPAADHGSDKDTKPLEPTTSKDNNMAGSESVLTDNSDDTNQETAITHTDEEHTESTSK